MSKYVLTEKDIVSKLALIEKHLGKCKGVLYTPTHDFSSFDEIKIQTEASKMLKFVGLDNYIACLRYTNTQENTGGNIDLDNSSNVFIEINKDLKGRNEKVLAVMAHEICHKVLYVHKLYYPNLSTENEILTDLATVYVGFGKLSLNGCYTQYTSNKTEYEDGKEVKINTTHKETIGYLSLSQFAKAYNIVSILGNYPQTDLLSGLNKYALDAIHSNTYYIGEQISKDYIKQTLKRVQTPDATLTNSITIVESILDDLKRLVKSDHQKFKEDLVLPFDYNSDNQEIDNQFRAAEVIANYPNVLYENDKDKANNLLKTLISNYEKLKGVDYTALLNLECPCCGYKSNKRLSDNKSTFVRCPKCGYYFIWDAEIKDNDKPEEDITDNNENEKQNDDSSQNSFKEENYKLKFNDSKKDYYHYLLIIFLLSYIPLCIFVDIHWIIKVAAIIPYTLIFYLISKYFLPEHFDNECVVTGEYDDGAINYGNKSIGMSLEGKFGYSPFKLTSTFHDSYGAYRTYLTFNLFFLIIPIKCLILKDVTTTEDQAKYIIYGKGNWQVLEALWLFLRNISISAGALLLLVCIGYIIDRMNK